MTKSEELERGEKEVEVRKDLCMREWVAGDLYIMVVMVGKGKGEKRQGRV
jgi:hypothetical protein